MDSIQDIIKAASTTYGNSVLATIIQIEGFSYRKAGTMMLLSENGERMGMISGGCLEEDLTKKALTLMQETETRAQKMTYDIHAEDDLGWGRGAGCNGIVHVLLEKVDANLHTQLQTILTRLDEGKTVRFVKQIMSSESVNMEIVTVKRRILANVREGLEVRASKSKPSATIPYNKRAQSYSFSHVIESKPRYRRLTGSKGPIGSTNIQRVKQENTP